MCVFFYVPVITEIKAQSPPNKWRSPGLIPGGDPDPFGAASGRGSRVENLIIKATCCGDLSWIRKQLKVATVLHKFVRPPDKTPKKSTEILHNVISLNMYKNESALKSFDWWCLLLFVVYLQLKQKSVCFDFYETWWGFLISKPAGKNVSHLRWNHMWLDSTMQL